MIRCGVECREVGRRSFERNSPPASLTLQFRRTPTVFGVFECMYKFLAVVRMILEILGGSGGLCGRLRRVGVAATANCRLYPQLLEMVTLSHPGFHSFKTNPDSFSFYKLDPVTKF